MTTKILFATHNLNKILEIQAITPAFIQLISLEEVNIFEDLPETSETIEANSAQKANRAFELSGHTCIAEDTGLEVEALHNNPGVYSARYAGPKSTSLQNIEKLLAALNQIKNRKARFKTVITYKSIDKMVQFEGIMKGKISNEPKGGNGFGYDSVFIPEGFEETLAEMDFEKKNAISHRKKAFVNFVSYLTKD